MVLWNPVDLGYAATYVMRAVVDGKLKPGATSVEAGKLGKLQVVNGSEILLGSPFIFDKSQHRQASTSERAFGRALRVMPGSSRAYDDGGRNRLRRVGSAVRSSRDRDAAWLAPRVLENPKCPATPSRCISTPGRATEYRRRHDAIWPELKALLKRAGVSNYSIHLDAETDILFAYLERREDHGWTPCPPIR